MNIPASHRIALLFNANKKFDREVIAGIAAYMDSTHSAWDLFLEEDFRMRLSGIERWQGDGIIADFDDPAVAAALAGTRMPVVAVGGSYQDESRYPAGVAYVATDNFKLIKLALEHLAEAGLRRFALFSLPEAMENRWAQERENAFRQLTSQAGLHASLHAEVFRGQATSAPSWNEALEQQIRWLQGLPKPIGIVAVSDARARQLMQACTMAGIAVPEQVALIGIDDDPLARMLTRIPLSSVIQGGQEIGRTAAHLLNSMLHPAIAPPARAHPARLSPVRILVPPAGINILASSRHEPGRHPHVMRARHFIRQYACQGIKSAQVADYVGISRSTLAACFREELGRSVHDEILRIRLDAATDILGRGGCRLADVARGCGFGSNQYMHAVFKRELGCTPRAWQDRAARAARGAHAPGKRTEDAAFPPSLESSHARDELHAFPP